MNTQELDDRLNVIAAAIARPPRLHLVQRSGVDDDATYQEGAVRFRARQIDYERHTADADSAEFIDPDAGRSRRRERWAKFWRVASSILGGIVTAVGLLLYVAWTARAMGQTPTVLVRSCPTQPTTTGFSACTNSQWSVPAAQLTLDVLRSGIAADQWIKPTQLIAGDRVFACTDPSVTAGAFKACPTNLAGQTNNWLDASKVSFGTTPPAAAGHITWSWQAPTTNSDNTPLTDLAGYHLYVRSQAVATYPAPVVITNPSTQQYLSTNLIGNQCAEITAFNLAGLEGVTSDEVCAAPKIDPSVPGKMTLTVK